MKLLKKTFMMSLAVFMLAGCSEERLPEQTKENPTNPEAPTPSSTSNAAKDATILRGTLAAGSSEGWFENDSLWIFTLRSMKHNSYLLSEGVGSANGTFRRTSGTDNYEDNNGKLYALTSPKYLYGFSSTMDGGGQVSVTIPNRFKISDVGAPEGCSRMPVPYWGIVTFGEDGKLQATFQGLTSLLKIDLSILPTDTRAVVLTTHSYTEFGDGSELESGDEEPLSGTFDTVLSEGAKLASNPIFYSSDTLRVNLNTGGIEQYRYIYLPVVAGTYTNLHVIAVTGDYRYPYIWDGKWLKTFKSNSPFLVNTIVALEPESTGIRPPKM